MLAGVDLLEICKNPALVFRGYEAVLSEAERSPAFRKRVQRASARVAGEKRRLLDTQLPRNSTPEQLARLRSDVALFTAQLASGNVSASRPQAAETAAAR